jgi:hypothetical protein
MQLKRFSSLVLISFITLGFGCNPGRNLQISPESIIDDSQAFESFNAARQVTTDDREMGGTIKNAAFAQNKLSTENISKNSSVYTFKTVQIKKGMKSDDGDAEKIRISGTINYPDDKNKLKAGANITVNVLENGKVVGSTVTNEAGVWAVSLDKNQFAGKSFTTNFQFTNKLWNVTGKSQPYQWQGPQIEQLSGDTDTGTIAPVSGSENAKAAFINDIYNRYLQFFKKTGVDITPWWKKQIKTVWPMTSNYYSWGTVNLSDADHWDVNGHEIGHAMTDIGTNSDMGGGQHKIDECYSEDLAWSEGFATFLSGAVSLDSNDEDARFEFLVPRRAPIRMENVPDDVCKGQKNEWRVSAAMWDLYDGHLDGGDSIDIPFKTIWASLSRKDRRIGSMQDAANSLKELTSADIKPAIDAANKFNTMF